MIPKLHRLIAGLWFGKIVFFSFFIAPKIFRYLEHDVAADLQNKLFPAYYIVGASCGLVLFVLSFFQRRQKTLAIALATALAFVGLVVLSPLIREAYLTHSDAMKWLHPLAVMLNGIALVLVAYIV